MTAHEIKKKRRIRQMNKLKMVFIYVLSEEKIQINIVRNFL